MGPGLLLQAQPLMAPTTMPAGVHVGTEALAFGGTKLQALNKPLQRR